MYKRTLIDLFYDWWAEEGDFLSRHPQNKTEEEEKEAIFMKWLHEYKISPNDAKKMLTSDDTESELRNVLILYIQERKNKIFEIWAKA